jgi:hypothetical protein
VIRLCAIDENDQRPIGTTSSTFALTIAGGRRSFTLVLVGIALLRMSCADTICGTGTLDFHVFTIAAYVPFVTLLRDGQKVSTVA